MPATHPQHIVDAVLNAIQESGCAAVLISPLREHPRKFAVTRPDGSAFVLWAYAWTLTPGGRPSLPHEYRIQMTTVRSPLSLNNAGPTVLLGYEPNFRILAGFDLSRHATFTTGSPSVQIDIRTIEQALQDGLAFDRKGNNEIAVAIRPDQFMTYVANADSLHRFGRQAQTFDLLAKASSLQPIPERQIDALTQDRKRIVQTISRLSRQANFRQQVLFAYGNRCAITKMQLRLVDAAHILPVGAPGSVDHVRNGIALSPTFHRAYDNGLIYLDDDYVMQINPAKEKDLVEIKLDGGLRQFRAALGKIFLPPDNNQWPELSFIQKANRFRQIK